MSRVRKAVVKKARHKKILKMAKGYRGRAKIALELLFKELKRLCNMPIEIVKSEKETLEDCGSKELMLPLESRV